MTDERPRTGRELRSQVQHDGTLRLCLETVDVPEPQPNEVLIRVEASPINPSDLALLFAWADLTTAKHAGTSEDPIVTADIPAAALTALAARLGTSMAVGNEGAGTVIGAGSSERAQSLVGRTVAVAVGGMYTQYRWVDASLCLELPAGTTPAEAASSFVNPLTALGMVETMRREGHTALVHTAAASNLGQMLNKLCLQDQIPLVNIVRKAEQVDTLRALGATYVCNSSASTFKQDLTEALIATSATLAFDAIGGGKLAGQILSCMEAAATANPSSYSRYGSTVHKQVYIYGGLDSGPTEITRDFGFAWGVGGWLLTPFLQKIGPEAVRVMQQRVAAEITTTFASTYAKEISLAEALHLDAISAYARRATGAKYLLNPQKDLR